MVALHSKVFLFFLLLLFLLIAANKKVTVVAVCQYSDSSRWQANYSSQNGGEVEAKFQFVLCIDKTHLVIHHLLLCIKTIGGHH